MLSLPALRAVRERFPKARVTVAAGVAGAAVVELSGYANATIPVDRVALRDGPKAVSVWRIARLVRDIRRRRFDFVIDLHSLSETNLLGFFSGASNRLFASRPGRSLDFLSNVRPASSRGSSRAEAKHAVDRYLEVLRPLGIDITHRAPRLLTRREDDAAIEAMLLREKANTAVMLAGLFPGAGHPSRRWPLERFVELAESLTRNDEVRIVLFAGPEERPLVPEMRRRFPSGTVVLDRLSIPQLASALARLSVFVSNDTGPLHIAAAVGTAVVALLDKPSPRSFAPLAPRRRLIYSDGLDALPVEKVYQAVRELIAGTRTESLFAGG